MTDSTPVPIPNVVPVEHFRVQPGQPVRLHDWSPRAKDGFDGKKNDGEKLLVGLTERL